MVEGRRPTIPGRGRALRLVIVIVIVILLLWAVDVVARVAAESLVERRIQAALGSATRPDVQVRGPFFLPQLVAGTYSQVEVDAEEVTGQGIRLSPVRADLRGVAVPLGDLIDGTVDRVLVDRSTVSALIRYDDLNRYLEQDGQPFTVSAGADGGAHVEGTVTVAGQPVDIGGDVDLTVEEGVVRVGPRADSTGDPGDGQPLTFTVPVPDLPFGQQLEDVDAGPDGVRVDVTGLDVVLER